MSVKGIARRAAANGVGTPTTAPIYNNSSDNSIRAIVSGSGTTETVIGSNIRPVITLAAASTTLTAAQSGSTVVFNTAAGQIAILPAITVGLWFKFFSAVLPTSLAHEVSTSVEGTDFLIGAVQIGTVNETPAANPGPKWFQAVAASNFVEISLNGTTTGGSIGSWFTVHAITATQWQVDGHIICPNGTTVVTPFFV